MTTPFDPDALGALYARARAAEDAGDGPAAARLFADCLAMDPDDHCGVALRLAHLGAPPPKAAPSAYVATLFDQQADGFEAILVGTLGYQVPTLARALAAPALTPPHRALDLGCGTGLVGTAFADVAPDLTGVDLSAEMLGHADATGHYGDLYVGEAVAFMAGWDEAPFDLIIAADILPYLGDLTPFAAAARQAAAPGALVVASTERGAAGWSVTKTQRFAHAPAYLDATFSAAGFSIVARQDIVVRLEEGVPVAGELILARAPA
ncbi:MAG: methyltransferase domain-containing protein [Pseudomonadota bacterium]